MEKYIFLAPFKYKNDYSHLDHELIKLLQRVEYTGNKELLKESIGYFPPSLPENFIINLGLSEWDKFRITINVKINEIEKLGIIDSSFGQPACTNHHRNQKIKEFINDLVDKGILYLK